VPSHTNDVFLAHRGDDLNENESSLVRLSVTARVKQHTATNASDGCPPSEYLVLRSRDVVLR
jgi:hypothetical protein